MKPSISTHGPTYDTKTLPCGCIPGYFLCPRAVALWEKGNHAYMNGDMEEYRRLREEYYRHVGVKEFSQNTQRTIDEFMESKGGMPR